jgi:hypothetical protein
MFESKKKKPFGEKSICCVLYCCTFIAIVSFCQTVAAFEFDVKGTKVKIGGYAKLMMIYDTDGRVDVGPTEGDCYSPYEIAIDGNPGAEEDDFRMHARESRINIGTKTVHELGTLETFFEGDSYGDIGGTEKWTNSRSFRMRHFLGKFTRGKHVFLAGQTWSTFMDLASVPPSMDFSIDPGVSLVRQPQVRYQYNLNRGHYLAISVENPERGLIAMGPTVPFLVNPGKSEEKLPDFIAKYFFAGRLGHISPKVVIRHYDLNGETTTAWGVALTGHINIPKGHKFYGGVTIGDGIGRYGGIGLQSGVGLTMNNEIETVEFWSAYTGVKLSLKPNLDVTIGAGYSECGDEAFLGMDAVYTGNANKEAFSWHSNIKWRPIKSWEIALGIIDGEAEVMDGREGDQTRLQSYAKFSF